MASLPQAACDAIIVLCNASITCASFVQQLELPHHSINFYSYRQNFTLCEEQTGDVVTPMRFIFEECDNEHVGNIKIMSQDYTLWNVERLMQNVDFQHLLDRVLSLEKAIFRMMWK